MNTCTTSKFSKVRNRFNSSLERSEHTLTSFTQTALRNMESSVQFRFKTWSNARCRITSNSSSGQSDTGTNITLVETMMPLRVDRAMRAWQSLNQLPSPVHLARERAQPEEERLPQRLLQRGAQAQEDLQRRQQWYRRTRCSKRLCRVWSASEIFTSAN